MSNIRDIVVILIINIALIHQAKAAVTIDYVYDKSNRLTHVNRSDSQKQNYAYDTVGNITENNDIDTDDDGLFDSEEAFYGTNINLWDSDFDGVSDRDEIVTWGTIPTDADYDNDGLKDGFEIQYQQHPGFNPYVDEGSAGLDPDGDGLTNIQEQAAGSSPANLDSDYDGVGDGLEVSIGRSAAVNEAVLIMTIQQLLINCEDTDEDGLDDCYEETIGTDVYYHDSDGDGVTDLEEVMYDGLMLYNPYSMNNTNGTDLNANEPDTDGDGFSDLVEINGGSNPLSSSSTPSGTTADGDMNNDGIVNAADVLIAMRIITGQITITNSQMLHGDVAPLENGIPSPNGQFNLGDLLIIQRKALGVLSF